MRALSLHALSTVVVLGLTGAAVGCGHQSSVAPSQVPQTDVSGKSTAPGPVTTRQLSGRVLDESGGLVARAVVVAWGTDGWTCCSTPSATAITDGSGAYRTTATVPAWPFHYFGTEVTITAGGFDATDGWAPGTNDATQDFRLFRAITIAAGGEVHLTITPENSLCGLELEFRCRTIHVTTAQAGTLTVDTASDNPSSPVWVVSGDRYGIQYPFTGQSRLVSSLPAGASLIVEALRDWTAPPQGFTVRTSLSGNAAQ